MNAIAKTNELHAYLRQCLAHDVQETDGYTHTVVCLVLEQAVLAVLCEMQGYSISDPRTLDQQIDLLKNDASNWLVARICREYYESGHWLNDLRIARMQLLQSAPQVPTTSNSSMIVSTSGDEATLSLYDWLEGLERLMAEVREFNVEY